VTQDPEQQQHTAGGESSQQPFEPVPVAPGPTTPPGADREVLAAGGHERERAPGGAALRGLWRRQSVRARAVTAAATVVALGLGGTVAYAATSSGAEEGGTSAASGSASPSPDGHGGGHGGGHGLGQFFGMRGVHGEATVKDEDTGKWVVRTWQRGTVEKVDGDQVTVRSEDGAEWTWTVGSDTKVHLHGTPGTGADALKKGEEVFLIGSRSDDGTRTASRVLAGTWKEGKHKGEDKGRDKGGPGDRRGRFPGHGGHGPQDWRAPSPSSSPSGSGAAA
jgi:hypothetical protein